MFLVPDITVDVDGAIITPDIDGQASVGGPGVNPELQRLVFSIFQLEYPLVAPVLLMDLVGETGTGILVIHAHIEVNLCFLRNIKETFASKHEV